MGAEKQLNLWGDDSVGVREVKRTRQQVFGDYDAFVAKFDASAPKTTDDCYTPQPVYEAILEWLREKVNLEGRPIVRPFYPGGDYENEVYPENCVVVDNPPFSILSKILKFYNATHIDYFLFAPALTLFSCTPKGDCAVVTNVGIVYANGAVVSTGFHTSLFPGKRIMLAGSLKERIEAVDYIDKPVMLPKYDYPDGVETAARLHTAVGGGDLYIADGECEYIRALDAQRAAGKGLFGNGYLICSAKAREIAKARERNDRDRTLYWELSAREKRIIARLDAEYDKKNNSAEDS